MKPAPKLALLPLIALTLAGATGGAYAATSCPRGQIYRVSQHSCISRDEAAKLGLVHGAAPAPQTDAEPAAETAPETAPDPAPEAAPAPKPAPKSRVKPVRVVPARPAAEEPELGASPMPPIPEAPAATAKPAASAQNPASPFGVLDPGNVPAPLR